MPPPSLPGSQAATNASDALISGLVHSGRPDRKTDTIGVPFDLYTERFAGSNAFGTKST